jgi:hypothetical protein
MCTLFTLEADEQLWYQPTHTDGKVIKSMQRQCWAVLCCVAHMLMRHVAAQSDHLQQALCSGQLLLHLLLLRVAAAHKEPQ